MDNKYSFLGMIITLLGIGLLTLAVALLMHDANLLPSIFDADIFKLKMVVAGTNKVSVSASNQLNQLIEVLRGILG